MRSDGTTVLGGKSNILRAMKYLLTDAVEQAIAVFLNPEMDSKNAENIKNAKRQALEIYQDLDSEKSLAEERLKEYKQGQLRRRKKGPLAIFGIKAKSKEGYEESVESKIAIDRAVQHIVEQLGKKQLYLAYYFCFITYINSTDLAYLQAVFKTLLEKRGDCFRQFCHYLLILSALKEEGGELMLPPSHFLESDGKFNKLLGWLLETKEFTDQIIEIVKMPALIFSHDALYNFIKIAKKKQISLPNFSNNPYLDAAYLCYLADAGDAKEARPFLHINQYLCQGSYTDTLRLQDELARLIEVGGYMPALLFAWRYPEAIQEMKKEPVKFSKWLVREDQAFFLNHLNFVHYEPDLKKISESPQNELIKKGLILCDFMHGYKRSEQFDKFWRKAVLESKDADKILIAYCNALTGLTEIGFVKAMFHADSVTFWQETGKIFKENNLPFEKFPGDESINKVVEKLESIIPKLEKIDLKFSLQITAELTAFKGKLKLLNQYEEITKNKKLTSILLAQHQAKESLSEDEGRILAEISGVSRIKEAGMWLMEWLNDKDAQKLMSKNSDLLKEIYYILVCIYQSLTLIPRYDIQSAEEKEIKSEIFELKQDRALSSPLTVATDFFLTLNSAQQFDLLTSLIARTDDLHSIYYIVAHLIVAVKIKGGVSEKEDIYDVLKKIPRELQATFLYHFDWAPGSGCIRQEVVKKLHQFALETTVGDIEKFFQMIIAIEKQQNQRMISGVSEPDQLVDDQNVLKIIVQYSQVKASHQEVAEKLLQPALEYDAMSIATKLVMIFKFPFALAETIPAEISSDTAEIATYAPEISLYHDLMELRAAAKSGSEQQMIENVRAGILIIAIRNSKLPESELAKIFQAAKEILLSNHTHLARTLLVFFKQILNENLPAEEELHSCKALLYKAKTFFSQLCTDNVFKNLFDKEKNLRLVVAAINTVYHGKLWKQQLAAGERIFSENENTIFSIYTVLAIDLDWKATLSDTDGDSKSTSVSPVSVSPLSKRRPSEDKQSLLIFGEGVTANYFREIKINHDGNCFFAAALTSYAQQFHKSIPECDDASQLRAQIFTKLNQFIEKEDKNGVEVNYWRGRIVEELKDQLATEDDLRIALLRYQFDPVTRESTDQLVKAWYEIYDSYQTKTFELIKVIDLLFKRGVEIYIQTLTRPGAFVSALEIEVLSSLLARPVIPLQKKDDKLTVGVAVDQTVSHAEFKYIKPLYLLHEDGDHYHALASAQPSEDDKELPTPFYLASPDYEDDSLKKIKKPLQFFMRLRKVFQTKSPEHQLEYFNSFFAKKDESDWDILFAVLILGLPDDKLEQLKHFTGPAGIVPCYRALGRESSVLPVIRKTAAVLWVIIKNLQSHKYSANKYAVALLYCFRNANISASIKIFRAFAFLANYLNANNKTEDIREMAMACQILMDDTTNSKSGDFFKYIIDEPNLRQILGMAISSAQEVCRIETQIRAGSDRPCMVNYLDIGELEDESNGDCKIFGKNQSMIVASLINGFKIMNLEKQINILQNCFKSDPYSLKIGVIFLTVLAETARDFSPEDRIKLIHFLKENIKSEEKFCNFIVQQLNALADFLEPFSQLTLLFYLIAANPIFSKEFHQKLNHLRETVKTDILDVHLRTKLSVKENFTIFIQYASNPEQIISPTSSENLFKYFLKSELELGKGKEILQCIMDGCKKIENSFYPIMNQLIDSASKVLEEVEEVNPSLVLRFQEFVKLLLKALFNNFIQFYPNPDEYKGNLSTKLTELHQHIWSINNKFLKLLTIFPDQGRLIWHSLLIEYGVKRKLLAWHIQMGNTQIYIQKEIKALVDAIENSEQKQKKIFGKSWEEIKHDVDPEPDFKEMYSGIGVGPFDLELYARNFFKNFYLLNFKFDIEKITDPIIVQKLLWMPMREVVRSISPNFGHWLDNYESVDKQIGELFELALNDCRRALKSVDSNSKSEKIDSYLHVCATTYYSGSVNKLKDFAFLAMIEGIDSKQNQKLLKLYHQLSFLKKQGEALQGRLNEQSLQALKFIAHMLVDLSFLQPIRDHLANTYAEMTADKKEAILIEEIIPRVSQARQQQGMVFRLLETKNQDLNLIKSPLPFSNKLVNIIESYIENNEVKVFKQFKDILNQGFKKIQYDVNQLNQTQLKLEEYERFLERLKALYYMIFSWEVREDGSRWNLIQLLPKLDKYSCNLWNNAKNISLSRFPGARVFLMLRIARHYSETAFTPLAKTMAECLLKEKVDLVTALTFAEMPLSKPTRDGHTWYAENKSWHPHKILRIVVELLAIPNDLPLIDRLFPKSQNSRTFLPILLTPEYASIIVELIIQGCLESKASDLMEAVLPRLASGLSEAYSVSLHKELLMPWVACISKVEGILKELKKSAWLELFYHNAFFLSVKAKPSLAMLNDSLNLVSDYLEEITSKRTSQYKDEKPSSLGKNFLTTKLLLMLLEQAFGVPRDEKTMTIDRFISIVKDRILLPELVACGDLIDQILLTILKATPELDFLLPDLLGASIKFVRAMPQFAHDGVLNLAGVVKLREISTIISTYYKQTMPVSDLENFSKQWSKYLAETGLDKLLSDTTAPQPINLVSSITPTVVEFKQSLPVQIAKKIIYNEAKREVIFLWDIPYICRLMTEVETFIGLAGALQASLPETGSTPVTPSKENSRPFKLFPASSRQATSPPDEKRKSVRPVRSNTKLFDQPTRTLVSPVFSPQSPATS